MLGLDERHGLGCSRMGSRPGIVALARVVGGRSLCTQGTELGGGVDIPGIEARERETADTDPSRVVPPPVVVMVVVALRDGGEEGEMEGEEGEMEGDRVAEGEGKKGKQSGVGVSGEGGDQFGGGREVDMGIGIGSEREAGGIMLMQLSAGLWSSSLVADNGLYPFLLFMGLLFSS